MRRFIEYLLHKIESHTKRDERKTGRIKEKGEEVGGVGCNLVSLNVYRVKYNIHTNTHKVFKVLKVKDNQ